ncbi:MAG: site-specific DNA-methyltransferase [Bdellovibrionales bacterium]|nr:site-specific DNA-methyltransferase [Bdellovibrionales bacterium]
MRTGKNRKAIPTNSLIANVFSHKRNLKIPNIKIPSGLKLNQRMKMGGLKFLKKLKPNTIPVAFFDPQYRGILDKLNYGNEGKQRGVKRGALKQMTESTIGKFITLIEKALIPSGHLFLWIDKFHLCSGFHEWFKSTQLDIVDMITWDKGKIGMGYRSRRRSEYMIVLQKQPRKAKGVWKIHNIPDVWLEKIIKKNHTHQKPIELQANLLSAVSNEGDIVIDPASGSFSVLEACKLRGRNFLGCDING